MDESRRERTMDLDQEGVREDITKVLSDVRRICDNKTIARAMGEKTLQGFEAREADIRRRMNDGFQLVVVGEFKRGKSTLINALLGEELAPTAVTPETLTWNRIAYAQQEEIRLVLKNRRSVKISREELRRKRLQGVLQGLPAPLDYVDIHVNNDFLKEVTLVDTPGLDDISSDFSEQTAQKLTNADAIIFVVSALAPLSQSEIAFLSGTVVPQGFTRIFLAVNMSDRMETRENLEIIQREVERKALPVSDRISVYMLSALDEYHRRTGQNRIGGELEQPLEENFLAFETALNDDILLQQSLIRTRREVTLTVFYLEELISRIRLTRELIREGLDELGQKVQSFETSDETVRQQLEEQKTETADRIQDMKRETIEWMRDFLVRMREELSTIGDDVPAGDLQRYLQFYIMDSIRDAVMLCVRQHESEVNDMLLSRVKILSGEVSRGISQNIQSTVADSIRDYSWTNVDNVVFVGNVLEQCGIDLSSGVLAPFYLIAQSIAGAVRLHTISRQQRDLLGPVIDSFDSISDEVSKSLEEIYRKLGEAACAKLDEAYARQVEVSKEALDNVRNLMSDENLKSQDTIRELDQALELAQKDLAKMRMLQEA